MRHKGVAMVGNLMYFFHTAQLTSSARPLRNPATAPGFLLPKCRRKTGKTLLPIHTEDLPMTKITRCKMTLRSKGPVQGSTESLTRLHFGAVWSANPAEEDAIYGKYTPYGEYVVNVAADRAEHFEEGKDYYFDISPAF